MVVHVERVVTMATKWEDDKLLLCYLIKKCSNLYGGDDLEWLKGYAREVVALHTSDLGRAILCFKALVAFREHAISGKPFMLS